MTAAGLHLSPLLSPHPRRPSALAEVDATGRLVNLTEVSTDDEIVTAVPPGALLAVDAPLDIPNEKGTRDLERVIAWCDVPLFPVAGARLDKVVGGRRGADLAERLRTVAARAVEASPELVLREILFEREQAADASPLDLADYRRAWLETRPPAYRPKGAGRAKPEGLVPARRILAEVLEMDGYQPSPEPGDFEAIAEAARIDAIACAYAAHRAIARPHDSILFGAPGQGEMLIPADANLRGRLEVNLGRMKTAGEVSPALEIRGCPFS